MDILNISLFEGGIFTKKKRLLICGISMSRAGTEKAMLSFLNTVDRAVYDVTLLLALQEGELMEELPNDVRLIGPMQFGPMFTLSGKNAPKVLSRFLLMHPTSLFLLFFYTAKILLRPQKRSHLATRMWVELMKRYCPDFASEFHMDTPFDIALSFWGDRTMFYVCDKVKASRHLTWLHFDYEHPHREDALYRSYFSRCHRVVSVTEDCTRLLRARFPELAPRMITFENRISPARIRALAGQDLGLSLPHGGLPMILTVARVCEQKGIDRIPAVLSLLKERGISVNWYILGEGAESEKKQLVSEAKNRGVADRMHFLGTLKNPYPLFALCDVFALPSRYEGKPITVEEAKILGCPIVVCDYLAAREQLQNGTLGIIVPQDGGEGMALAIAALMESSTLREQYRSACLDSVPSLPGQGAWQTEQLLSSEI